MVGERWSSISPQRPHPNPAPEQPRAYPSAASRSSPLPQCTHALPCTAFIPNIANTLNTLHPARAANHLTNPTPDPGCLPRMQGTTSVWYTLDPAGRTGVLPSDPAYAQVQRLAAGAQALGSSLPCPDNPRLAPVFPPVPNCPAG